MDQQLHNYNDDEKAIDLRDMFAELLRKWKQILTAAVLGAVIGCAAACVKESNSQQIQNDPVAVTSAVDSTRAALDEPTVANVEELYLQYIDARKQLQIYTNQYMNSLYNSFDPDNTLTYQIEYTYESDQTGIALSYIQQTLSVEDLQSIGAIYGLNPENYRNVDVVSITDQENNIASGTVGNADAIHDGENTDTIHGGDNTEEPAATSDADSNSLIIIQSSYKGLFRVTIAADSQQHAEQTADIVEKAITRHTEDLANNGVTISLHKTSEQYVTSDRAAWRSNLQADSAVYNVMQKVNALSDDSKAYFNALVNDDLSGQNEQNTEKNMESAAGTEDTSELTEDSAASTGTVVSGKSVVKYSGIGFIAGLALIIFLYILIYVCSDTIKTPDDLEQLCGMPVLGHLYNDPVYHGISGKVNHAADRMEFHGSIPSLTTRLPLTAIRISNRMANDNIKNIYLIADRLSDNESDILQQLQNQPQLKAHTISTIAFDKNYNLVENISKQDAFIILGKLKNSQTSTINNLIQVASETGARFLGACLI